MTTKINIALDSGAHSIFNESVQKRKALGGLNLSVRVAQQKKYDLSYVTSKRFTDYMQRYVDYLHAKAHLLEFYITLDVIQQPKLSYEITRELVKEKLMPVPVVHYGTDLKWFKKYMDDHDYIAISGLGKRISKRMYVNDPWVRDIFKLVNNSKGVPQWKVHGLGLSHIELIDNYPWYSVDASTPFYSAHVGELCVPTHDDPRKPGQLVYRKIPICDGRIATKTHYLRMSKAQQSVVDATISEYGFTMEVMKESYAAREFLNLLLFNKVANDLQKRRGGLEPLRLYVAGSFDHHGKNDPTFYDLVHSDLLERHGVTDVYYLGTFYAKSSVEWWLRKFKNTRPQLRKVNEDRRPRLRT